MKIGEKILFCVQDSKVDDYVYNKLINGKDMAKIWQRYSNITRRKGEEINSNLQNDISLFSIIYGYPLMNLCEFASGTKKLNEEWCACAYQGVRNVRFSVNLVCSVFL